MDDSSERRPAAQYIRMSREHQRYSPENQRSAIAAYAQNRGFDVVRTYQDDGRSGLTLRGRAGLKLLLNDVLKGDAPFSAVLVLDVSRWGRFQDVDQSAHYEFLCREAGVQVHYCAEAFENDGSIGSTILKSLKRVMAGEFSRELGQKVLAGQINGARLGFKQGGIVPLGVRRILVDENGAAQRVLNRGQWKSLTTDRVVCAAGPAHEVAAVRRIFRWFVEDRLPFKTIAYRLAEAGIVDEAGMPITRDRVGHILRNEIYVGIYTYNRTTQSLRHGTTRNPPSRWVRTSVMEPMVSRRIFAAAQERLSARGRRYYSDEALLDHLRALIAGRDTISSREIEAAGPPSTATYYLRFRSLVHAIRLCGGQTTIRERRRDPERGFDRAAVIERLKVLLEMHGYLSIAIINADPELPCAKALGKRFGGVVGAYRAAGWEMDQTTLRQAACRRRWARSSLDHPVGVV